MPVPLATVSPFYSDWTFWAVIVSAMAVILSQLPPVWTWFKKAKLEFELFSKISISHKIGNPNIQLYLTMINSGGRSIKLKSITADINRDGQYLLSLKGQNYLNNQSDSNSLLLTSINLKPNDEWSHIVNFFNYFSRDDERQYKRNDKKIREEIVRLKNLDGNKDKVVVVDDTFTRELIALHERMFIWKTGEYEIDISIKGKDDVLIKSSRYHFTIFEADSSELDEIKNDYCKGDGVFYNSINHNPIIVQINLA